MLTLALHHASGSESQPTMLPQLLPRMPGPRMPISIRLATERDLPFIDALMKQHSKMVGFASTTELLDHIEQQTALIAEAEDRTPIGYCLYRDRYMKREDCGYVSQLNVAPGSQRGLVGAALVQAMFERVPWGVRLFCCWCAQDLQANSFWEALGFVPLAFRTGSRPRMTKSGRVSKEGRMHIFWQRRVRDGDACPYWFPSQTTGGRMGEARIVLPIMAGTHWSDAKPMVLPGEEQRSEIRGQRSEGAELTSDLCPLTAPALPKPKRERKPKAKATAARPAHVAPGGLWVAPPKPIAAADVAEPQQGKRERRPRMPKQKNDPKYIAAARELRDRYLEQVNSGGTGGESLLPASAGKYDVSRQLDASPSTLKQTPLLKAAC